MYGVKKDAKKIKESIVSLNVLYNKIPKTKGCLENITKENGCKAWCCHSQNPQVLYVEFLNTWNTVIKTWHDERFESLIEKCLRKYLFPEDDKGCIFIDSDTHKCLQHESRPFNCRIYGIIPDEEFKPRYERLKVIYPDTREQCNLVSTIDGEKITVKHTENWWLEANAIEMSIGVSKELINDSSQGSYRTYHDHFLIQMLGEQGMEQISNLRVNGTKENKEITISNIMSAIKKYKESVNEKRNASS